jgi:hypothetical protein
MAKLCRHKTKARGGATSERRAASGARKSRKESSRQLRLSHVEPGDTIVVYAPGPTGAKRGREGGQDEDIQSLDKLSRTIQGEGIEPQATRPLMGDDPMELEPIEATTAAFHIPA